MMNDKLMKHPLSKKGIFFSNVMKIITDLNQNCMKKSLLLYSALGVGSFFISINTLSSQTIDVSGVCATGTIVLTQGATVNGKPSYSGTGTVAGIAGTAVSIEWLTAPDNVWVLEFDGQPYFSNANSGAKPIPTAVQSWTNLDPGTCPNTPALSLSGSGVLPVELAYINAELSNHKTALTWKTENENNNKGFEIQRSADGKVWDNLGFINGVGTSLTAKNYQFIDEKPLFGINYYRLKQIDFNDESVLSKVVSVTNSKNLTYQISPNPTKGLFTVNAPKVDDSAPLSIMVFDLLGRKVLTETTHANESSLDLSAFSAGTYIVEILYDNQVYREKLIKR